MLSCAAARPGLETTYGGARQANQGLPDCRVRPDPSISLLHASPSPMGLRADLLGSGNAAVWRRWGAMRFASTARHVAAWGPPHPPRPHRRRQQAAGRSRAAGALVLSTTTEGRFAGCELLASSETAALPTLTRTGSGNLRSPSSAEQGSQTSCARVSSCLDAIHLCTDIGPSCVAGDLRLPQRALPWRRRALARPGRLIAGGSRRWHDACDRPAMAGEPGCPLRPGSYAAAISR